MKYILDTNICVYLFKGKFEIDKKLINVGLENCSISEITLAELVYGAENSSKPEKHHELINSLIEDVSIIPIFDAIQIYGKQKSRLRKQGLLISDFDFLIGSTAIANDMVMVTQNTREFERLEGIKLEDWTK